MLYLFTLLALLLTPLTAQATIIWQENWEGSPASIQANWAETSCGGTSWPATSNPGLSTAFAFGGTHSLHAHYQGHQQEHITQGFTTGFLDSTKYGGCFSVRTFSGLTDVWFMYYEMQRAYTPQTSFFIDEIGTKDLVYWYAGNAANSQAIALVPTYYTNGSLPEGGTNGKNRLALNFTNISLIGGSDNIFPATSFSIVDNHWVCYEWHIKLNSAGVADGSVDSWATDMTTGAAAVKLITNTARQYLGPLTTSTNPSDATMSRFKVYVQDGWGDIYQDNHTVSTTRVGCGASAPDTTPPTTAPTSLTAPQTSATSSNLSFGLALDPEGMQGTVILRCQGVGCTPTANLTTVPVPATTFLDTTLAAGTVYGYRAQGINNAQLLGPLTSTVYLTTPAAGSGAIAFDAVTNSAAGNTLAALPVWSHTVGAGANRLIAVCTQSRGTLANVPVVSVTYGGAALALARGDTRTDGSGVYFRTELWYLKAPTSGAANVSVNFTGTVTYGVASALSYSGVDQTTPIEASAGSSGTGTTLSATVLSLTSDAWIQDCALGRADTPSGLVSVGAGQVSRSNRATTGTADAVGVSTVNGKTPAGSEVMDWTQGTPGSDWVLTTMAIKPAATAAVAQEPAIDSVVRTPTIATITYGTSSTTLPTSIRIQEGNNAGTITFTQTYLRTVPPFTSANGTTAVLTQAITPGSEYFCATALNASGVPNPNVADRKCAPPTVITAIDTAAPVLGSGRANGNTAAPQLPNGATTFTLSVPVDKTLSVACLWDTSTHATYSAFPTNNVMSFASLVASASIVTGVPAYPATQLYYWMCQFTDLASATHDSALGSMTVSAAAPAGDTTKPVAVNVTAFTAEGPTQATITYDATTDNVLVTGYIVSCSFGTGATNYVPCANDTLLTTQLLMLPPNTVVNAVVYAHDAAGNISLISNVKNLTMPALQDINPPNDPGTLAILGPLSGSVILTWPAGSDREGSVTASVEQCLAVAYPVPCTDFAFKQNNITLIVATYTLAPSTSYCWRMRFVDQASNPSIWSNVVCGTTLAASVGTGIPRTPLPPGVNRTPRP